MGKGATFRANLRATRAQMNNAATSAQARAFKARQLAKQKRDAEERKLREAQAAAKNKKESVDTDSDSAEPSRSEAAPRSDPPTK